MLRIIAAFMTLLLTLSALPGYCVTAVGNHAVGGATQSTTSGVHNQKVVNIILDKIESGVVYSQDGRTFHMTSTTEVINNTQGNSKLRIAELIFMQGMLVSVHIK